MARLPYTDVRDLLASAERFALAVPAIAGALGRPTSDASLERVREGLFYLGAACVDRVRELDAEGQRALADVVAPDLLRPLPSATILELTVEGQGRRVPAGAEVMTKGPRPCRFRTVSELRVGPWGVEGARVEGDRTLRFDLVVTAEDVTLDAAIGGIRPRFYLGGGPAALRLLAHLLAHTESAEIALEGGARAPLGRVLPYGTRADQALAPDPDGPHTGLSLVREYFVLPEKFSFFALGGLTAALRGTEARRATVTLTFATALPAQVAGEPEIRAHCVPAVNIFPASAEPWVFEPGKTSARVRVAGLAGDAGPYAVVAATALPRDEDEPVATAGAVAVPPVRRFAAASGSPAFPYAYSTRLVARTGASEPELVVALTSPRGQPPVLRPHVVSLELLATNRDRASRLRPGDLCVSGLRMPKGVRVRNIVPASPYLPPAAGRELALQIAVRAAVPAGDPLFALQSQLLALVPRGAVPEPHVRANVARIGALRALAVGVAVDGDRARRGYELRIELDETPFDGLGDAALFTRVLCAALDAQASAGRFYRCVVTATRSGARLVWPPAQGES